MPEQEKYSRGLYAIRDKNDYNEVYGIVSVNEEQWNKAVEYLNNNQDLIEVLGSDMDVIEKYLIDNRIPFEITYLPNDDVFM
jgi:hypothetical protein